MSEEERDAWISAFTVVRDFNEKAKTMGNLMIKIIETRA